MKPIKIRHAPAPMKSPPSFEPSFWLRNKHLQTLWPQIIRRQPLLETRRERLELPDGDFLDLDWSNGCKGPIVIVLHGLGGSLNSNYTRGLLRVIHHKGWRGVLMNFRGCSGEPNRLAKSYHAGEYQDFDYLIKILKKREPGTQLAAVGFSIGGSALIHWLAKSKITTALTSAVAISVPFMLKDAARCLNTGVSKIYQHYLLNCQKQTIKKKFSHLSSPIALDNLKHIKNFFEFDQQITAPLHGFRSAEHYYATCSARQYLKHIHRPTLILHAQDDPFMSSQSIPHPSELSSLTTMELMRFGGHVGFIHGPSPWKINYWLEERISIFLENQFNDIPKNNSPRYSTT